MAILALTYDNSAGKFFFSLIGADQLQNQLITSSKIAAGVIGTPHIAAGGILSAAIGANVIGAPHIQNQGILSANIGGQAIGTPHIAAGGILSAAIGALQVGTAHLADGAILSGKLGSGLPLSQFLTEIQSFVNLLENGDFEVGDPPTGWGVASATASREATIVKTGTYSCKGVSTGPGVASFARQSALNYAYYTGRKVTFGAWCYVPLGEAGAQILRIYDGVGLTDSPSVPKDGAWHWITVTRTIAVGATQLFVYFRIAAAGETNTAYIDGAILVEGDTCPAFSPKPVDIQSIVSGSIAPNIIATPHIAPGGILSGAIGAGAIGTPHIQAGGILSGAIGAQQIGGGLVADQGLLSGKFAPLAIHGADLDWGAVLSGKYAAQSIRTADLGLGQVLSSLIGANIIDTAHIRAGGILSGAIGALQVGGGLVANLGILSGKYAPGSIRAPDIGAAQILSSLIGAGAIGTPHIAPGAILSGLIGPNVIGTPHIQNQGILSAAIGLAAIGAPHLAWGGITSGKLASGFPLNNLLFETQSFVNLLENGDFEVGDPPTGWTAYGSTASADATEFVKGSKSIKVVAAGTSTGRVVQSIPNPAGYAGRTVTFGCWVKSLPTNDKVAQLRIYDNIGGSVSANYTNDGEWHWYTVTRTLAVGITSLDVRIHVVSGTVADADDTIYADGAILVEGDTCPAFSPKPVDIQSIVSGSIAPNIIATPHIAAGGILSAAIGAGQIGGGLVANLGILSGKYTPGSIRAPDIGAAQILSSLIAAGAIGTPHIAPGAILSSLIGANIIDTAHIRAQGILSAALGALQVGTPHIALGSILSSLIGALAIGTPHIAWGSILSGLIGAFQVGLPHLVPGPTSGYLLTAQGVATAPLYALAPPPGPGSILSSMIGSGQVGAPHIADGAIVSGKVLSGSQYAGIIGADRFPLARMPDGTTSGYVLTAQGAGLDPLYAAFTVAVTELFFNSGTLSVSTSWETISSGSVPATAKKVIFCGSLSNYLCNSQLQVLYNGVQRLYIFGPSVGPIYAQVADRYSMDGLGVAADVLLQVMAFNQAGPYGLYGSGGCWYVTV